jgi:hypothetical protein
MVKFSDRWCPSTRQPHLPAFDGLPKTVKKYQPGLRIGSLLFCSSLRIDSRLMMVVALEKPPGLVPARSMSRAASRCSGVISSRRRPFRAGTPSWSSGTKCQLVRSLSSKANVALAFWSSLRVSMNFWAAAAIREPAGSGVWPT